jgi:hypothetical protein
MRTTTKFSAVVAALAAVFTLAVATGPIAPAAHAAKNDGRYATSSESVRKSTTACEDIWSLFETATKKAAEADAAGNTGDRNFYLDIASTAVHLARNSGCSWAARTVLPTPVTTVVSVTQLTL